jgi:3-dehydroquinate synthase
MIVAGELSKHLGLLDASELESLRQAVSLCGRLPAGDDLDEDEIIDAMSRDKKSVAGKIKWVLLERIGRPRIVDAREVSRRLLKLSLREGLRNAKE